MAMIVCSYPSPIATNPILFFSAAEFSELPNIAVVPSGMRRPMKLLLVKNDFLILFAIYCVTQAITYLRIFYRSGQGSDLIVVFTHRLLL